MKFCNVAFLSLVYLTRDVMSFHQSNNYSCRQQQQRKNNKNNNGNIKLYSATADEKTHEGSKKESLNLPPELQKITTAFSMVGDDSMRHKQLLYMANQIPAISQDKMTPENKVPGCLSTVYVDGSARWDDAKDDYVVDFVGDSDGLLTKGLVALLIRGLSGSTAQEIERVNPEFIQEAQIGQSLTPGRNNGFLNMLAVMKKKAIEITENEINNKEKETNNSSNEESSIENNNNEEAGGGPTQKAILQTLQILKPTEIVVKSMNDDDKNFSLYVRAAAFEDLNLIKREKLVLMLLGEIMPNIENLTILGVKTPDE